MLGGKVADDLIRDSLPQGWVIGDKTGAGGYGLRSILAVVRPPYGEPWLAAVLLKYEANMPTRDRAIARIGAAIVGENSSERR